jgi:DNA-binding NarL/FixJ family response regulator
MHHHPDCGDTCWLQLRSALAVGSRGRIAVEVQPGQTGVRVVVADDDVLLREGVASLLANSGYRVVAQAGDAVGLLELVRVEKPDLVIVDIRMPPTGTTEGLDAAMIIRDEMPEVGLVILSAHIAVEHAMQLLASGRGIGYLLKTRVTDVSDFLDTLGRVAGGACVIDPALVQELVDARRRNDPLAVLSPREKEVLALMAEGRSNAGIGRRLWVTEGTVEKHVRSIMTKLDLHETPDDHRRVRAVITFLEAR